MPPVAGPPAHFTILLFGIFRLCANDRDIPLRGRKACALLAYLALAPHHRASREQLAVLLWTDRGAEQARASLRQTLAELRAIAGMDGALAISRGEVALEPDHFDSDLARVMAACASGNVTALAATLGAIQGALLESFGDVSPAFDDWLAVERPARAEEVVSHSLACLEQHGMNNPEETQAVLRALDRLDPYNEGVARLGMRLDHAAGDSAALHRRYRRLVDLLQSEFGAAPAEATRSLFQQLAMPRETAADAGGASAAPAPVPAQLHMTDELVPAVVVAPLQVIGAAGLTPDQADFCTDDMRLAIAGLHGIKVLAADSADIAGLIDRSADSLALYLLSGKLRDPGSGPVAMMQLANARDRTILWSQSIPLDGAEDPVGLLVAKAVGALQPAIDRDLQDAMRISPELGDERALYTRARLQIRGAADLPETLAGVAGLERILERNPRHLGAHLLLARMYNTDYWQQMTGHDVRAYRKRGAHHLDIAASLAPHRVNVRVQRAWVLLRRDDWGSAAREFDAVLADRQLDPDILNQCAMGLCCLGDLARSQTVMQQAFELNPFAPSDYHADYARIKALAGEAEDAEDHFLVSGESGLMYDAFRIANFAAFADAPDVATEVQDRFARKFIAAWQGSGTPRPSDVIEWFSHTNPLRQREHREFVGRGLEERLPQFWPAS